MKASPSCTASPPTPPKKDEPLRVPPEKKEPLRVSPVKDESPRVLSVKDNHQPAAVSTADVAAAPELPTNPEEPLPSALPRKNPLSAAGAPVLPIPGPIPSPSTSVGLNSDTIFLGHTGKCTVVIEEGVGRGCVRGDKGVKVKECIDVRGWNYVVDEVESGSVFEGLLLVGDAILMVNNERIGIDREPLQLITEAEDYLCLFVKPMEEDLCATESENFPLEHPEMAEAPTATTIPHGSGQQAEATVQCQSVIVNKLSEFDWSVLTMELVTRACDALNYLPF